MARWRSGFANFQRRTMGVTRDYGGGYLPVPTVLRREGKMLTLTFEYNATLVERIKADIHWYARQYREDRQDWLISPAYGRKVIALVKEVLGEEISVTEEET